MESPDLRKQLLDAALETFMEFGYRASMDAIARRAGVAKQTLYNHFASKPGLFHAVIHDGSAALIVGALDRDDLPLRERLILFARALRTRMFSPQGLAMYRLVVVEALDFPAAAREAFEAGPGYTRARLTEALQAAVARGEIGLDSPALAAEVFMSITMGFERLQAVCEGLGPDFDPNARVECLVDLFLKAFDRPGRSCAGG